MFDALNFRVIKINIAIQFQAAVLVKKAKHNNVLTLISKLCWPTLIGQLFNSH